MKLPSFELLGFARPLPAMALSILMATSGITGLTGVFPAQQAVALGVGAATGDQINCGDIGFLVAVSGTSKQQLGKCPLKHTDVKASVSGYVSRVSVKQQFHNPFKEKIEAIYTFPLPENAAVDEMTMTIGNRVIKGDIKKREEARQIYEAARSRGNVASLLDQERPNIFTQTIANIEPGQTIDIEVKYVNLLKYDAGTFTFAFPTVVGPRFIPGKIEGHQGSGVAGDTDMVPDASKISPPMAEQGERAGHDISISLDVNSGIPIQRMNSKLHDVTISREGTNIAHVQLKPHDKIPNKDFVLSWDVASDAVRSGYLTHGDASGGYFTLMMIPPKRIARADVAPKEMIFLIDCSGSQQGLPLQKAKETMQYILDHMNPQDTFQIISFNSGFQKFAENSEAASHAMKERAGRFLQSLQAHGGTWMGPPVEAALALPNPGNKLRIVTFMTDGLVGNDLEVIGMIKKYRNKSRWFSFGTGNSVNRFLIDKIAAEGGGEADYVYLGASAEEVGKKFYDRISSPVLTDIKVVFQGVETKEVFPKENADLWAQRPLYITGRYTKAGQGKAILTGFSGGKPYRQEMNLSLPASQPANAVLKSIWARAKVDRLMAEDWFGIQSGTANPELKDEIIATALKYHLMTQYTSFVAVEEDRVTKDGKAKTVVVPVEVPEGVNVEPTSGIRRGVSQSAQYMSPVAASSGGGSRGGGGGGGTGWSSGPVSKVNRTNSFLPPTSMGKYVHAPGDNQYAPGASYGGESDPGSGSGYGSVGGAMSMESKARGVLFNRLAPSAMSSNAASNWGGSHANYGAPAPITSTHAAPSSRRISEIPFGKPEMEAAKSDKTSEKGASNAKKMPADNLQEELKQSPSPDEESRPSLVQVRLELKGSPNSTLLKKLRQMGFKLGKRQGKFLFGSASMQTLRKLLELPEFVAVIRQ